MAELSNLLQGFAVTYNDDKSLTFTQIHNSTTHGGTDPLPAGTAAAEIHLSVSHSHMATLYKPRLTCPQPDNRFLTLSSRLEKSVQYTLANGTTVPSDPLISYSIDAASGALTLTQISPAGGANPRHFSFNKDGTLVASALQGDGRVVIFERDTASGKIGKTVAEADVVGAPNFVIFK